MRLLRSARWLLLALVITLIPVTSHAQVFLSVHFGPPALPVYVQPPPPAPDLMWVPGHWRYNPVMGDYFWVPGTWVAAPAPGLLWTPGYWGWSNGLYLWHEGYWGRHIGYYGGVNYGFGYGGMGFAGGEWRGGHFAYNTAVMNVDIHDRRFANAHFEDRARVERSIVANPNHVAYAGGPGGINHPATAEERVAEHEQHTAPTKVQEQHSEAAKADKTSYGKANGGHPTHTVAEKPLAAEKNETKPAPKTETKPAPKNTMMAPKSETKPAPKSETKPAPKNETKPAPKTETKPAPKNTMMAPKNETKPAPKPQNKPAPKPENKPAPKPKKD